MKENKDKANRLTIELFSNDSTEKFIKISNQLTNSHNAILINKIEGLDQKYWDYKINDSILVLQSDTFCGISIYFEDKENEDLLRSIAQTIMKEETQNKPAAPDRLPGG